MYLEEIIEDAAFVLKFLTRKIIPAYNIFFKHVSWKHYYVSLLFITLCGCDVYFLFCLQKFKSWNIVEIKGL